MNYNWIYDQAQNQHTSIPQRYMGPLECDLLGNINVIIYCNLFSGYNDYRPCYMQNTLTLFQEPPNISSHDVEGNEVLLWIWFC